MKAVDPALTKTRLAITPAPFSERNGIVCKDNGRGAPSGVDLVRNATTGALYARVRRNARHIGHRSFPDPRPLRDVPERPRKAAAGIAAGRTAVEGGLNAAGNGIGEALAHVDLFARAHLRCLQNLLGGTIGPALRDVR